MKIKDKINFYLNLIGFDKNKLIAFVKGYNWFNEDKNRFLEQAALLKNKDFNFSLHPILNEKYEQSGQMNGHYFHQDLLIAQKIFKHNPNNHLDIGSSIYGFVSNVASFRKIDVADIRDNKSTIENISFLQIDLMNEDIMPDKVYDSISCLHVLEHFGLGRYNDPVDYLGYEKGINNINKYLKKDGLFYMSVPIGRQRVEFNAHRVFNHQFILNFCKKYFELIEFNYVDDNGDLYKNINPDNLDSTILNFSCGIFIFKKK